MDTISILRYKNHLEQKAKEHFEKIFIDKIIFEQLNSLSLIEKIELIQGFNIKYDEYLTIKLMGEIDNLFNLKYIINEIGLANKLNISESVFDSVQTVIDLVNIDPQILNNPNLPKKYLADKEIKKAYADYFLSQVKFEI